MATTAPSAAATDTKDSGSDLTLRFVKRLIEFVPVIVLAALVIVFTITTPSFVSQASLVTMGSSAGVLLISSIGLTVVVIAGGIDMSVGAVALLTGAVLAALADRGHTSIMLLIATPLVVAVLAGAANGAVATYGRVPSFIITLGSLSIFTGLGLTLLDGSALGFSNDTLLTIVNSQPLIGVSGTFAIALVIFFIAWIITRRTRFGVYLYAIGSNERVAALSGISVRRIKFAAFAISGLFAGVAGLLSAAQIQSVGPTLGSSLLLDSIAALAIGGTSLAGGAGGVSRTFVGALILSVLSSGLNQIGVEDFTQTMIKGSVVVVAATLTLAGRRGGVVK